ncbi:hypothetical protein RIF29_21656 [Crotalaria pallida]|uniref:RNase H type-1 domain-containing protein n=1 Tax=Crotalaria pallida TaxID=3830 RepID=A0AAN9I9N1_CROPI
MGFWDGLQWNWNLSWRRHLYQWEQTKLEELWISLKQVSLDTGGDDKPCWSFDRTGTFTVKSFQVASVGNGFISNTVRNVWRGLAPPRAELLVWFVLLNRLNTRSRLKRLGIISNDGCPYGPGDIRNNIEAVRSWHLPMRHRPSIAWVQPPAPKIKWNVDGSSLGKPGPAGIGGVLRDSVGTIWCQFAASIGIEDSNIAEFMAIIFALETSLQQPWMKEQIIIVESDSRTALSWAKNYGECPWKLQFRRNKLVINLIAMLKKVEFIHQCSVGRQIALLITLQNREGILMVHGLNGGSRLELWSPNYTCTFNLFVWRGPIYVF